MVMLATLATTSVAGAVGTYKCGTAAYRAVTDKKRSLVTKIGLSALTVGLAVGTGFAVKKTVDRAKEVMSGTSDQENSRAKTKEMNARLNSASQGLMVAGGEPSGGAVDTRNKGGQMI